MTKPKQKPCVIAIQPRDSRGIRTAILRLKMKTGMTISRFVADLIREAAK